MEPCRAVVVVVVLVWWDLLAAKTRDPIRMHVRPYASSGWRRRKPNERAVSHMEYFFNRVVWINLEAKVLGIFCQLIN